MWDAVSRACGGPRALAGRASGCRTRAERGDSIGCRPATASPRSPMAAAAACSGHQSRGSGSQPALEPGTRAAAALVPPIASVTNPIDLTPRSTTSRHGWSAAAALDVIAADPGLDALRSRAGRWDSTCPDDRGDHGTARARGKTVCVSWPFGRPRSGRGCRRPACRSSRARPRYPCDRAPRALSERARAAAPRRGLPAPGLRLGRIRRPSRPGTMVGEHDCHRILAAAGSRCPRGSSSPAWTKRSQQRAPWASPSPSRDRSLRDPSRGGRAARPRPAL